MVAGGVPPSALFGESMAELTGGPMVESTDDAADESAAAMPIEAGALPTGPAMPVDLIASASCIASIMLRHVGLEVAHPRNDPDRMAFWSMTRFIYYHYGEPSPSKTSPAPTACHCCRFDWPAGRRLEGKGIENTEAEDRCRFGCILRGELLSGWLPI